MSKIIFGPHFWDYRDWQHRRDPANTSLAHALVETSPRVPEIHPEQKYRSLKFISLWTKIHFGLPELSASDCPAYLAVTLPVSCSREYAKESNLTTMLSMSSFWTNGECPTCICCPHTSQDKRQPIWGGPCSRAWPWLASKVVVLEAYNVWHLLHCTLPIVGSHRSWLYHPSRISPWP